MLKDSVVCKAIASGNFSTDIGAKLRDHRWKALVERFLNLYCSLPKSTQGKSYLCKRSESLRTFTRSLVHTFHGTSLVLATRLRLGDSSEQFGKSSGTVSEHSLPRGGKRILNCGRTTGTTGRLKPLQSFVCTSSKTFF